MEPKRNSLRIERWFRATSITLHNERRFIMKNLMSRVIIAVILIVGLVAGDTSYAQLQRTYEITITNITPGQVLSPPVVIAHNHDFALFTLGEPAIEGLATVAESGNPDTLTAYLETLSSVWDYAVGGPGVVMPGESRTVQVTTSGRPLYISVAGMLGITNDAFFAVRGVKAPVAGEVVVEADAYDAGSEANTEDCLYVPGPPCGGQLHDDINAPEGFVHVHSGIHGIGGLDPAIHDWRNPVAEIIIKRVSVTQ